MGEGREPLVTPIRATDESFFERCGDLSWKFFRQVFGRFIERLVGLAKPRFCAPLAGLQERFTGVLIIDGSRLAAIAHKLKILWEEQAVVLPGCLLVVYDLLRRIPWLVEFSVDAAASELMGPRRP